MNLFHIFDQLAELDPDIWGRFDQRRAVFKTLGNSAKNLAAATSPLLLSTLFQKAYAGELATNVVDPIDVLNYALTLELLEASFYGQMVHSSVFNAQSPADKASITQIKKHEDAHVNLLNQIIGALPTSSTSTHTPVSGVSFKAALFPDTDWAAQLKIAQLLEDTGVRAYKGRLSELQGSTNITVTSTTPTPTLTISPLSAALRIHSVEARHAAQIRLMRGQTAWVSPTDTEATDPTYTSGIMAGSSPIRPMLNGTAAFGISTYDSTKPSPVENNTLQAASVTAIPLDITTGLSVAYSATDAAAAFDEYLQPAEVLDNMRAGGLLQF